MIEANNKFAFCFVACAPVRIAAQDESEIISQMVFGEPLEIISLNKNWSRIKSCVDGYEGFVDPKQLHPLSKDECERWNNEYCFLKPIEGRVIINQEIHRIPRGSFVGKENLFFIGKHQYQNLSAEVNSSVENIGARRLHTIIEKVLDEISFNASDKAGEKIIIDKNYVQNNLGNLVQDTDLSKFIL